MALLPMSRRALTVLDAIFWITLLVAFMAGRSNVIAGLLLAALVLAVRVAHGLRFPRLIGELRGEDLKRARVESGREWLPVLDEQRPLLSSYQNRLLDEAAAVLARASSPRVRPGTCVWRKPSEELQVEIPVDGYGVAGLKSWYRFPTDAFIGYGMVDTDEQYDFDLLESEEVVFSPKSPDRSIAQVMNWLEAVVAGPRAAPNEYA